MSLMVTVRMQLMDNTSAPNCSYATACPASWNTVARSKAGVPLRVPEAMLAPA